MSARARAIALPADQISRSAVIGKEMAAPILGVCRAHPLPAQGFTRKGCGVKGGGGSDLKKPIGRDVDGGSDCSAKAE